MITEWKNTDPRHDVGKRANIVIIRPHIYGNGVMEAACASVDTKNVYCIFTDFDNHKLIDENEDWDQDWMWTWAPRKENDNV